MPLYDFRCRTCDERFEARLSMAESDAPVPCPGGHHDTVKLLGFAAVGGRAAVPAAGAAAPVPMAGGCCGGACGCG